MSDYTPNFSFELPVLSSAPWKEAVDENFRAIDALLAQFVSVPNFVGQWMNSTVYVGGQVAFDNTSGDLYIAVLSHTSPASPTTFATDRTNNPTRWQLRDVSAASSAAAAAASASAAAASAIAAAASAATVASDSVRNTSGANVQVVKQSLSNNAPIITGFLSSSPGVTSANFLSIALNRTSTTVGLSGPVISLTGPDYPGIPSAITINTGVFGAYKVFLFDAAGGLSIPAALSVTTNISAAGRSDAPIISGTSATLPRSMIWHTGQSRAYGQHIDGSGNWVFGPCDGNGILSATWFWFSTSGAASFVTSSQSLHPSQPAPRSQQVARSSAMHCRSEPMRSSPPPSK